MAQILSTGYQRSGKGSRVTVGGTVLVKSQWQATLEVADLDTTNFESDTTPSMPGGESTVWSEGIDGIASCAWSFSGDWDANANPLDAAPGVYPRYDLANMSLYISKATLDNTFWNFPYARVRSAENSTEVTGKVTFAASGQNQGGVTLPTGSV